MLWVYVLIAGLFEIGWIYSLKSTEGFTRLAPLISYAMCGLGAAFFLSLAMKSLPVGVTYAVWVGIAVAGSNMVGILFLGEHLSLLRAACIGLILAGVIGLKTSMP